MKIKTDRINGHCQRTQNSCVPMSVELVLKLLGIMPVGDFSLQYDPTKSGNSNWIKAGFSYPISKPKVAFSREYFLPDIGLKDRGAHFMKDYFVPLFKTIDDELDNCRFVIISLESGPSQWHMEVIFNKVNENEYETITFYHNVKDPAIYHNQNLKDRVTKMQGTDILTYKWI